MMMAHAGENVANNNFDHNSMTDMMSHMMGSNINMGNTALGRTGSVLSLIISTLIIILLIALIRWIWKKGNK